VGSKMPTAARCKALAIAASARNKTSSGSGWRCRWRKLLRERFQDLGGTAAKPPGASCGATPPTGRTLASGAQ